MSPIGSSCIFFSLQHRRSTTIFAQSISGHLTAFAKKSKFVSMESIRVLTHNTTGDVVKGSALENSQGHRCHFMKGQHIGFHLKGFG